MSPFEQSIIEQIKVGNPNRLVKTARKQHANTGNSGLIFNSKSGEIAIRDAQLVATFEYWEFITQKRYPVYENGNYIEDHIEGIKMIESCSNCKYKTRCLSELIEENPDDWEDLWDEDDCCPGYKGK